MNDSTSMCNENHDEVQDDQNMIDDHHDTTTPHIGQQFDSPDEAYNFYNEYARKIGFSIKIHYTNKHKYTKQITSRRFSCSKEGNRHFDKRDYLTTNPRAETRTKCKARMKISLLREPGKFKVCEFEPDHTHCLHLSSCAHMMRSQRQLDLAQKTEIDLADDSGIKPKETHEFMAKQSGGIDSLGYTRQDHKNYLRTKREQSLKYGEAGSLLKYFQNQLLENPSFYYAIQMDCEEQITNIFWADPKMIIDYAHFGDVVTFDTTFGTNKEYRPFGVFAGFNHHRETVIFGASLLYDETIPSFEWLFKTFLKAHKQKKPLTIFTDQDAAMAHALSTEMVGTRHGLCTWHIMQNGITHLGNLFKEENVFFTGFKKCMFDCEEEKEFNEQWNSLLLRYDLRGNSWLERLYNLKEKWAKAYMKTTFSIGMRSTQLSESINSSLKDYLEANMDLKRFFRHFERVVIDKRYKELQAEYDCREKLPKIRMKKSPMLNQVAQIYTPRIFNLFQEEYDEYQGALIKSKDESQPTHEYAISIYGKPREYKVLGNRIEETVSCGCRKFETFGILCCHALKVLDVMDIKLIPTKYIIKRWTREARSENIENCTKSLVESDHKLKVSERYRTLYPSFVKIVSRASECKEAFTFLASQAPQLSKMVEDICKKFTKDCHIERECDINTTTGNEVEDLLQTAKGLKKKNKVKAGKRHKPWPEKQGNKVKVGVNQKKTKMQNGPTNSLPIVANNRGFNLSKEQNMPWEFYHNNEFTSHPQFVGGYYLYPQTPLSSTNANFGEQYANGYRQSFTDLIMNGVPTTNNGHQSLFGSYPAKHSNMN